MGQRIGDYRDHLNQMQRAGVEQKPLGLGEEGKLGVREPVNPPTGWTKFKAALSHVPLFGKIGSLRQARAEVESYPVRLRQFQVESRQIMAGFVQSLRAEYGDSVATTAMHDVDQTGTTPLTGRSVRTILANAEQAKKSRQANNQMSLTRFLESPIQGGTGRAPGEKDMVGILFDRGLKMPENATSWKDFLGEKAGNWAENYMRSRLQEHPDYSTGRIPNADLVKIAQEALDLVAEAKAQGLSTQDLDKVFEAATKPGATSQELTRQIREFSVRDAFIVPQLDRKNPDSMLCQTAKAVAKEMGLSDVPDAVLKSIENNVKEAVCFSFAELPKELKCGSDSASIRQALAPVLKSKVETLLREHGQALALIEKSVLTEPQKAVLRNIATTRRMDPTQVRTYEKFATQLKSGLGAFKGAITAQNAQVFCSTLLSLKTTFEDGMDEMQRHGAENWESGSIKGGERTTELMGEMMRLALADLKPEERTQLYKQLTSDEARSVLSGLRQSQDLNLSAQLPLVYAVLTDTVGTMAGLSAQEIDEGMSLIGKDVPHEQMSPSALMLASKTEQESHCVDSSCRHKKMVDPEFSGSQFREEHAEEWAQTVSESQVDETGLASAFNGDLGRGRFFLNGQLISAPGNSDKETSRTAFLKAFTNKDGTVNMKLATAVSKCFNQRGVNNPMVAMMQAALKGGAIMGHSSSDFEAWQGEDGSWNIRCTARLTTDHYVTPGHEGELPEDLGGKGYMLASVTYGISPESIRQGNPQIEVTDSRTFFSF